MNINLPLFFVNPSGLFSNKTCRDTWSLPLKAWNLAIQLTLLDEYCSPKDGRRARTYRRRGQGCPGDQPRPLPSLKLTYPLKIGLPNRKLVFQPSIFRCKLLVSGRVLFGPTPYPGRANCRLHMRRLCRLHMRCSCRLHMCRLGQTPASRV